MGVIPAYDGHDGRVPEHLGEPLDVSGVTLVVVLAAGAGRRFSGPDHKLATRLPDGRTVAEHSLAAARASGVGPVVIVIGAIELALPADVARVRNADWEAGQATSLRAAVAHAEQLGAEAIVVGLADQPLVPHEAWRRVAASTAPIAVATYADSGADAPRNPVRLHRSVWPLLPTDGDHGARELIRSRPDLVERVPCPGSAVDLDRLEDLTQLEHRWQSNSSTNSS
jgi:molybdenum cofactor cytidylyltransferase